MINGKVNFIAGTRVPMAGNINGDGISYAMIEPRLTNPGRYFTALYHFTNSG